MREGILTMASGACMKIYERRWWDRPETPFFLFHFLTGRWLGMTMLVDDGDGRKEKRYTHMEVVRGALRGGLVFVCSR